MVSCREREREIYNQQSCCGKKTAAPENTCIGWKALCMTWASHRQWMKCFNVNIHIFLNYFQFCRTRQYYVYIFSWILSN